MTGITFQAAAAIGDRTIRLALERSPNPTPAVSLKR